MTALLATDSGIRYIYALKGRDDRVRYVGQTNDPDRRLEQHRKAAVESTGDGLLFAWLRSLDQPVTMTILETVDTGSDTAKVNAAERRWIKTLYAAGEPLTNTVGVPGRFRSRPRDCRVVGYDVPISTFEDVASRLAISISTVRRLAGAGHLDVVRLLPPTSGGPTSRLKALTRSRPRAASPMLGRSRRPTPESAFPPSPTPRTTEGSPVSKTAKPRCPDCRGKIKKNASFCTACGTHRDAALKSITAETDPVTREFLWNAAYEGGFIGKVARP